jgi:hypothetical protein
MSREEGLQEVVAVDCGVHVWRLHESGRVAHEDFYLRDELWDAVCPDDEVDEWTLDGVIDRRGQLRHVYRLFRTPARSGVDQRRLSSSAATSLRGGALASLPVTVEVAWCG